jgi:4-hydroxy-tetrahydrodipicolinate synthase
MNLRGLGVALITPFTKEDKLDIHALEKIVSHLVDKGADYIVMLGTTAESVTLDIEEKIAIVETVKSVNKHRIPLVLGIGGNNTSHILDDFSNFDFTGIDAILSVCPYYNKPSQAGIIRHYETIANVSPKPVILYNVPSRTSVNMTSETTLKLAQHPNIIGMKEASGIMEQVMNIIKSKPDSFSIISGDDLLTLPFLSVGMDGVISVTANAYPAQYSSLIKAAFSNNYEEARQIHYKLQEMVYLMFCEGSPSGIKALMNLLGYCENKVRMPLCEVSEHTYLKISKAIAEMH